MVGALDRSLRENLQTQGLRDPAVTILDPATGTGTFLLGIAERVWRQHAGAGPGMAALALQDLARRMYGFELLVGPYAVAHFRLHHALRRPNREDPDTEDLDLPRLGVFLADTLAEPGAAAQEGPLGFVADGIRDERHEANRVKTEQPILAIIGNPPYRRLEEGENRTLVGNWMDRLWDDLKEPVREAGQGNKLNTFPELSVAFWRWAIWKLFESENAPQRGVVAFITNRKFMTGWPYAGLRKMMRERFDRIEIIDLRGDVRRGVRAGIETDQGVFNIQVGTAITLAIADGTKAEGEAAEIHYRDTWEDDRYSRAAKLDWLEENADDGRLNDSVQVERDWLDDMRPRPFQNGEWSDLPECFLFSSSGLESKRDHIVYGATREQLQSQVETVIHLGGDNRDEVFNSTPMNSAARAQNLGWMPQFVRGAGYRPLDRRWHYSHDAWNDRPRPALREAWGAGNRCLFALPSGTNAGPAIWCYADYPDRHAFRGSYGGYAFPLYDRRRGPDATNVSPALLRSINAAYGEPVAAEDLFDAILCLLSATSYSERFAEDLEDVFPHMPFPARLDVFREAVRVGREIRAVETFARPPGETFLPDTLCRIVDQPRGNVGPVDYIDGGFVLCDDGTGRVTGIPEAVWVFSVSGYSLLPRWLGARVGLPADFALVNDMRDICGRISELIDLFAEADTVLEETLENTLTRAALGFEAED